MATVVEAAGEESFLSFLNGLIEDEPWLVLCEHFFDQVIHSNSSHVLDEVYLLQLIV